MECERLAAEEDNLSWCIRVLEARASAGWKFVLFLLHVVVYCTWRLCFRESIICLYVCCSKVSLIM
jgi:hypothetical protein